MKAQQMEMSLVPGGTLNDDTRFFSHCLTIIESGLHDPGFGVPQLTRCVHLTRTQLKKKLLQLAGITPGKLIMRSRLQKAAQLLNEPQLTVKEIAGRCGFKEPASFCRSFFRWYNCSPSIYRSRLAGAAENNSPFRWKIPLQEAEMAGLLQLARQQPWLEGLLKIVVKDIGADDHSVERLAGAVYMTPNSLYRKMKETLEISPRRFITDLKLHYASELLATRTGTVAEVAYQAGFFDQAHLCRNFKAVFGCQPSAWRPEQAPEKPLAWLQHHLLHQNGK